MVELVEVGSHGALFTPAVHEPGTQRVLELSATVDNTPAGRIQGVTFEAGLTGSAVLVENSAVVVYSLTGSTIAEEIPLRAFLADIVLEFVAEGVQELCFCQLAAPLVCESESSKTTFTPPVAPVVAIAAGVDLLASSAGVEEEPF